jgi:DNA polymerase I-like protein with 3'-5' exonuclease and polymerase domains
MITLERIERIWEGFSARFGEWEAWADNETATARATGFQSWPPFNRKHPWAMPETIEETKIRNTPIQRAAGDVVNLLFKNMDREVRARGLDAHFTLHAHDACLWDVALEHRDAMLELVNRHFDYQLQSPGGHRVHIYGQAKAGRTLAEV